MTQSKFLQFQDENGDRLIDECEVGLPGPAEKLCLGCRPNPFALVSLWTEREDQTVEFNGKKCTYEFNYQTDEQTTLNSSTGDAHGIFLDLQEKIVDAFFEAAVKKKTPEAVNLVNEKLKFEEMNLYAREISYVNLLLSLPFDDYQLLEDQEDNEEEDVEDGPIVVTFDADMFDIIFTRVRKGLHLYGRYQKMFQFQNRGIVFLETGKPLNLASYGDFIGIGRGEDAKLKTVFRHIADFLNDKNYSLSPVTLVNDKVTKIRFVFSRKYKLKKIKVKSQKCREKWIKLGGISKLNRKAVFKDPTAMAYLANSKLMEKDLTARVPMPWTEFIIKHTYPEVIVKPQLVLEGNEQSALSCITENLTNEVKEFGQDVLDESFGLFEAIGHMFRDTVCFMTEEERMEHFRRNGWIPSDLDDIEDYKIFGEDNSRGKVFDDGVYAGLIKLNQEDGFDEKHYLFSDICNIVCGDTRPTVFQRNGLDELFKNLDRIKVCGLLDLLLEAINCLLGGLSLEEALSKICASALRAMSLENLDVLFIGLPPDKQQEIALVVQKRLASGQAPQLISTGDNIESADTVTEIRTETSLPSPPWSGLSNASGDEPLVESPGVDSYGNFSQGNIESNPLEEASLASNYDLATAAGFDGGTPETAIGLWIEAILEVYADDLLGLVDILNRFPGAQLIANIISLIDCPRPPIMDPNLLDFLNSIDLPFCKNNNPIVLPRLINPFYELMQLKDYWFIFKIILVQAIKNLIASVIKMLFCKICDILNSAVCTALALVGDLAEAAFSKDSLRDIMKETLCGEDVSDQLAEEALAEMFEKYGANPDALADKERFNNFLSDLSSTMTTHEISAGILGDPSRDGLRTAAALVRNSYPEFENIFGSESDIADFLQSIGNVAPVEVRNLLADNLNSLRDRFEPSNPSLCASEEQINQFCAVRASILEDRVTPEELEALCVQGRQPVDLEELTNILQQGIPATLANNLPPLVSEPGCDDGILPYETEQQQNSAIQAVTNGIDQLKIDFTYDMIGNGPLQRNWGMINMMLSDVDGDPLTTHIRQANRPTAFGKKNVDFYLDPGDEDELDMDVRKIEVQKGAYPLYVGEWLFNQSLKSKFDSNLKVQYKNDLKDRKRTTTGEYGVVSNFDYLDEIQHGYRYTYEVDYENDEFKVFSEPRKQTPNVILHFQDNNQGKEDEEYQFSFKLRAFYHDLEENDFGFGNTKFDSTRVVINNTVVELDKAAEEAMDKARSRKERRQLRQAAREKGSVTYRHMEFLTLEDTFDGIDEYEDLEAILLSYQTSEQNKSPQAAMLEAMTGQSVSNQQLEQINEKAIISLRDKILDKDNPGFLYGAKFQGLSYEQTEYVVNDRGQAVSYGQYIEREGLSGNDEILGISRMQFEEEVNGGPRNRVHYLSPKLYGGSYANPKIYIEPEQNEGWLGLIDIMFPEVSPCKPYRVDVVDFDEIEQEVQNGYSGTPEDKRIFSDPDCVIEKPFDRILERVSKVGIGTAIKSACKIYVSTHIIKTLPVFAKIKPDFTNNFSDIYSQFIVEDMENSLKDSGGDFLSSFKESEFWYSFLEQSVQYYNDLEENGKITNPPEHIIHTLKRLRKAQKDYKYPQREDLNTEEARDVLNFGFARLKEYRFRKNLHLVKTFEDDCKIILKELVKKEVITMADTFIENAKRVGLVDGKDYIHHMGYYFLQEICEGNSLDLQKEIELEIIGVTSLTGSGLYTDGNQFSVESSGEKYIGFYHSNTNEDGDLVFMAGEQHSDEEEQEILIPLADITALNIGDIPEYSTRSSGEFRVVKYLKKDGVRHDTTELFNIIDSDSSRLDSFISDIFPGSLEIVETESGDGLLTTGLTGELGLRYGLALFYNGQEVANSEVDFLDLKLGEAQPLTDRGGSLTPVGTKILFCLINKLLDDTRFKILTEYIFPMKKHAALLAIYVDYGLMPSIGEVTKDIDTKDLEDKPGMRLELGEPIDNPALAQWEQLLEDEKDKLKNEYRIGKKETPQEGQLLEEGDTGYPDGEEIGFVEEQALLIQWRLDNKKPPATIQPLLEPKGTEGWALFEQRSNRFGLFRLSWDNWDQETLIRSRRRLKRIFKQYYHNREFRAGDRPKEAKPGRELIKQLKENIKPAPGVRGVPWWRKRASNPLNAKNKVCKNRD